MTKFRTVTRDGFIWLTVGVNGSTHFIHRQGRVGDCIRPGQKMRE